MKKRKIMVTTLVIILVCLIFSAAYILYRRYSENTQMIPISDVIPGKKATGNETYIFLGDKYLEDKQGIVDDDSVYLPIDIVMDIDSKFYYDAYNNALLYTDAEKIEKVALGEKKDNYVVAKKINEEIYVNIDYIKNRTKAKLNYYKNPNRIVALNNYDLPMAKVVKPGAIRSLTGYKSPVVKNVKNELVLKLKTFEDWTKVVTEDGSVGYIETNKLSNFVKYIGREDYKNTYTYFNMDKKILLGWNQVGSKDGNIVVNNLDGISHINVISPTWFSVSDKDGSITSFASNDYVNKMHINDIKVWPLISDFDTNIDINKILENSKSRDNLVKNIVNEVKEVGADGINIDFEKINNTGSKAFIQFLRELYLATRKEDIVVSVDNYVPKNFNKFYNRKAQAEVVDYFIIMGYDEHTGDEVGSVSSYTWTKEGIEETLKDVPAKKVINGVPFYTKLWKETPKNQDTSGVKGNLDITFKNIGIASQDKILKDFKAETKWDKDTRQNYMEVTKAGSTYKMWLEDEKSMQEKIDVIKANNLAGVAAWKLGLENEIIWKVLEKVK